MKKRYSLACKVILLVIFGSWLGTLRGEIAGSLHDFSTSGWNPSTEICIACHAPHNTDTTVPDAPLWNHAVTNSVFTLYSSPTLYATPLQPQGTTKLCLSCHDGTIALDSFGGVAGSTFLTGDGNLGTNLGDDHPVSIRWQHQTELPNATCVKCHFNAVDVLPFFGESYAAGVYLECATCHDVHNGFPYPSLLRLPLGGSQLCFHCHGK